MSSFSTPKSIEVDAVECTVVLIGDMSVGKTSIIRQYTEREFIENGNNSTVDMNVQRREEAEWDPPMIFSIWDTAGQERFNALPNSTISRAHVILYVYSIDSVESFEKIEKFWMPEVKKARGNNVITFLIGNKLDLRRENKQSVSDEQAQELSKNHGCKDFLQVSAKTNTAIQDIFMAIANEAQQDPTYFASSIGTIELNQDNDKKSNSCGC